MFSALWHYRSFILISIAQEIRSRYAGSLLGSSWAVLQPLMMIVIYTIIFSQVMQARLPGAGNGFAYSVYLCAGALPWMYFAEILQRMTGVFIDNANLIRKTSIPRICLPAVVLGSSSVNIAITYALFIPFLLASGNFPGPVILLVPVALLVQTMMAIGLGLLLATLNVFFRDIGHATGIVLQFAFWFTPIVYPLSIVPEWARDVLRLNPMFHVIEFQHQIFSNEARPDPAMLLPPLVLGLILLLLGFAAYRRLQGEVADNV